MCFHLSCLTFVFSQRFDRFHCDIKTAPYSEKFWILNYLLIRSEAQLPQYDFLWSNRFFAWLIALYSSLKHFLPFYHLHFETKPSSISFPSHTTLSPHNHSLFAIHICEFIFYSKQQHPKNGWNGNEKWNASRYLEHVCKFTYKNFRWWIYECFVCCLFSLLINRSMLAQVWVLFVFLKLKNV